MNLFLIITSVFFISALFSFINARWIKLPGVIGVMVLALAMAFATVLAGKVVPEGRYFVRDLTYSIDFSKLLLDVLLGFLLFASALHFDVNKLRENLKGILFISTVGVRLSTLIFAGLFFVLLTLFRFQVPFIYCLLFGALISPTDAVAVAALLKKSRMPKKIESMITGESLFNDGIGLVLFISFLAIATDPAKGFSFTTAFALFAREVFGGLIIGSTLGWIAYRMMRSIHDFQSIVLISISLVMGISVVSSYLHVSIPIAVVAAGLIIGSRSFTKDPALDYSVYLGKFWGLIDELLNTLLFVMIGMQMVLLSFDLTFILIGLWAVLILLLARWLSVTAPIAALGRSLVMPHNSILIFTWGGLRGGISIAMALSIPASPYRELILTACFIVVAFSIIFQGLTLNRVVDRLL